MDAVNPLNIETIAYEVTTHLAFEDLQNWRQCSRTAETAFRHYFFGTNTPNGMRTRFWECLRTQFVDATDHIAEFQQASGALISGSFVLKFFAGHTWDVKDLDLIVPLNEKSIEAFVKLVCAIVPPKERDEDADEDEEEDDGLEEGSDAHWEWSGLTHITKFDSLDRISMQPKEGASCLPQGMKKNDAKYTAYTKQMRRKFSPIRSVCESYGYNKHVRAIFFAIDQLKQNPALKMDVVFVPEIDIESVGGLINWMKYNFDFQICANAITPSSTYCLAPLEIASRIAFCRMDQYCCDARIDEKPPEAKKQQQRGRPQKEGPHVTVLEQVRWENDWDCGDQGMCACVEIVPDRIEKYQRRGYFVLTGTCKEYHQWRAQNYP
jgi:hypothetical protein